MKSVLIIGASGQLGSRILNQLVNDANIGIIVATVRQGRPSIQNPKVVWIKTDVRSDIFLDIFENYKLDIVIHAAWDMHSLENTDMCVKVFEAVLHNHEIEHLIYLSTSAVYGTRSVSNICTENDALVIGKLNSYAEQKRLVEQNLKILYEKNSSKTSVSILRLVGVRETLPFLIKLNSLLPFPSPHTLYRQFIHSSDVIDAIGRLIELQQLRHTSKVIDVYNLSPKPLVLHTFFMPKNIIRYLFKFMWLVTRSSRFLPGKLNLYLHTPVIDGEKGNLLLNKPYREIK